MMGIAAVSTATSTIPVTMIAFIACLSIVAYCTFARPTLAIIAARNQKRGVHTQQELIDLVESGRDFIV
ncbi:hypothetical protein [Eggerthella lenta]|uniref:hypothetical protein n=1 Tax=Eggerthella lenta TaxID=84112 RepID=UPI0032C1B229